MENDVQTALCPAAPARQGASDDQAVPPPFRLELVPAGHPDRASLEAFIAAEFARVYGARLQHYCQVLAGCRGADGAWAAALGYSPARDASLFLEQYLDEPIEAAIGRRLAAPVARDGVVEVGNLAGRSVGAARALIVRMTHYLYQQGYTWVSFTATRALLNSFTRLALVPSVLAEADPARLESGRSDWGSYYDSKPQVMFGNIGSGHAQLAS